MVRPTRRRRPAVCPKKLARVSNHTPRNRQARFKEFESSPQDGRSSQSPRKLPTPITEARSSKSSLLGATRDRPMLRSRRRLNIEDVSQNKTLGRFSLHLRRCRTPGVYIFVYEMSAFASVRSRTAKRYSSEHSVELSLARSHFLARARPGVYIFVYEISAFASVRSR